MDSREGVVYWPMAGNALRVLPAYGEPGSVAVTALSETSFVVAHPSTAPGGEPAVMLTVYRLDGTQLRAVSTTLHRLGPPGGQRGGVLGLPQDSYRARPRSTAPVPTRPQKDSLPKPLLDTPAAR